MLKKIKWYFSLLGINPIKIYSLVTMSPVYFKNYRILKKQAKVSKVNFSFGKLFPILDEKYVSAGAASGHYFHQDLLVAHKIFKKKPIKHVDVGSRIDGFVAHVASFREIELFDIRPLPEKILNVKFVKMDLMEMDFKFLNYCESISCLHVLEHFGLGRYGDPINYEGFLIGFNNLHQILKKSGIFYFSVPIGPQRIEFNAHRVFSINYLLSLFDKKFEIQSFSFVDDLGHLHEDVQMEMNDIETNFDCKYGCGIFELIKL